MLRSADMLPDRYRHDRYLRRWTLFTGHPCCLLDALDTATATEEEIVAVEERNRVLAERLAAVEAFEDAHALLARVAAQDAPPESVPAFGANGQTTTALNPAWEAWQAALAVERDASELTRAYALVRAGQPPEEPASEDDISPAWTAYQQAVATIEAAG